MHENHVLFLRLNILMVWSASFLGCTTHLVVCLDDIYLSQDLSIQDITILIYIPVYVLNLWIVK